MKNIPLPLLNLLLSTAGESLYVVDLFHVVLKSGQELFATNGQLPVTYLGNTYEPTKYGNWHINSVKTAIGIASSAMEFTLEAGVDMILEPFGVPIMEAVQLGIFDAADVQVWRSYGQEYGETSRGVENKFGGQITEFTKNGRTAASGTVTGYTYSLNRQMPKQVMQPGCRWVLYDANTCTVNRNTYTYNNSVANGSNNIQIAIASPLSLPSGISIVQGVITFTSGRNSGFAMSIEGFDGTFIRLSRPFLFPFNVGDTFKIYAGCAHTFDACRALQSGDGKDPFINFGGTPYIPNQESCLIL